MDGQLAAMETKFSLFCSGKPRVILGSASSSRRQIMDQLLAPYGLTYTVRWALS